MLDFCDKLKSFRLSRREFQNSTEFYKVLGVSQATGSRYEGGGTEPPYSFLQNLIEVFGPAAQFLMPGVADVGESGGPVEPNSAAGMTAGDAAQRASAILREVKAAAPRLRESLSDSDWDFLLGAVAGILSSVPGPAIEGSLRQLLVTIAKAAEQKKKAK